MLSEEEIEEQCKKIVQDLLPRLKDYDQKLATCAVVSLGAMMASRNLPYEKYIQMCVSAYNYRSGRVFDNDAD